MTLLPQLQARAGRTSKIMLGCLVLLTPIVFPACGDTIGTLASAIDRWDFAMGNRGGGWVSFHAIGPEHGEQSGECRDPICHTTVDDLTLFRLTPVANEGFKFSRWDDLGQQLPCDKDSQDAAGIILLKISRNGACIAVFEPEGGGTRTKPPGIRW